MDFETLSLKVAANDAELGVYETIKMSLCSPQRLVYTYYGTSFDDAAKIDPVTPATTPTIRHIVLEQLHNDPCSNYIVAVGRNGEIFLYELVQEFKAGSNSAKIALRCVSNTPLCCSKSVLKQRNVGLIRTLHEEFGTAAPQAELTRIEALRAARNAFSQYGQYSHELPSVRIYWLSHILPGNFLALFLHDSSIKLRMATVKPVNGSHIMREWDLSSLLSRYNYINTRSTGNQNLSNITKNTTAYCLLRGEICVSVLLNMSFAFIPTTRGILMLDVTKEFNDANGSVLISTTSNTELNVTHRQPLDVVSIIHLPLFEGILLLFVDSLGHFFLANIATMGIQPLEYNPNYEIGGSNNEDIVKNNTNNIKSKSRTVSSGTPKSKSLTGSYSCSNVVLPNGRLRALKSETDFLTDEKDADEQVGNTALNDDINVAGPKRIYKFLYYNDTKMRVMLVDFEILQVSVLRTINLVANTASQCGQPLDIEQIGIDNLALKDHNKAIKKQSYVTSLTEDFYYLKLGTDSEIQIFNTYTYAFPKTNIICATCSSFAPNGIVISERDLMLEPTCKVTAACVANFVRPVTIRKNCIDDKTGEERSEKVIVVKTFGKYIILATNKGIIYVRTLY